jgi:hypothetical protein
MTKITVANGDGIRPEIVCPIDSSYKKERIEKTHNNTNRNYDELFVKQTTTSALKPTILMTGTILLLAVGFQTNDIVKSHLFTSLAIITATLTFYNFSVQKQL